MPKEPQTTTIKLSWSEILNLMATRVKELQVAHKGQEKGFVGSPSGKKWNIYDKDVIAAQDALREVYEIYVDQFCKER